MTVLDETLQDEVRWLGRMLGEVVRDHEGTPVLELVEEVRRLSLSRREDETEAGGLLRSLIAGLSFDEMEPLIQALSVSFDIANLAEDRHRVRVIRDRERSGSSSETESIRHAVARLHSDGKRPDEVQAILDRTMIEFVFTAHPTEAKRRSVREKVRDLRGHLYDLDDEDLLPSEKRELSSRVRTDLVGLWQTDFVRFRRPTVLEELDRSLFFAGNLWDVVPDLFRDVRGALSEFFPGEDFALPTLLRFGSWIGGDRDGNPNVTAEITAEAMRILRREALERHLYQARIAGRNLSTSSRKAGVSEELAGAISKALQRWPESEAHGRHLSDDEPYRRWLRIVRWRLERTGEVEWEHPHPEGAYRTPEELSADLRLMERSLADHHGELLAATYLSDWICQTEVFGFSLMRLDVRQESGWYHKVMGELLKEAGITSEYARLAEEDRAEVLASSIPFRGSFALESLSPESREALTLFRLLAKAGKRSGWGGLGANIISMTHEASDVLAVLWLGSWAAAQEGLPDDRLPIPIAPLFETIDDLHAAPETLDRILGSPVYRDHVRATGDRQIVMVGYSDSTKDGGYFAACWNLYEAQLRLQEPAERHGVPLVFFHGRGGALGRGGGPAARHIRSLPPGTFQAGLRITEQGEVLAERYDDPRIARRHLQQILSAVMSWSGQGRETGTEDIAVPQELFTRLSARSRQVYRRLVEHPGFIRYFEEATPVSEIEQLPIGSRPARRSAERSLGTLRAIPWVFSWTQSRHMIPAWYGLGTALEEAENDAVPSLAAIYRENAFFRATIDNALLALAKADMGIARMHASLVQDESVRNEIWEMVFNEYNRTVDAVLRLTGQSELLDGIPWLKRSIDVRNPDVDPLNLLQVELFRRLRALSPESEEEDRARALIRLTIQGISGGLRTTG